MKSEPKLMGAIFTACKTKEKYLPETKSDTIDHVQQLAAPLISRYHNGVFKMATSSTALFQLCSNPLHIKCQKYLCLLYYIIKLYF